MTKRAPIRIAILLTITLLIPILTSCKTTTSTTNTNKILAAASIPPISDFVKEIGGNRVEVLTMVPPGASPHTYEPTPAQMRDLTHAQVLFLNGVGLEFWADKAVKAANNPNLQVVVLSEGMPILESGENATGNPHLWLSPKRAKAYVERIRDTLIKIDPEGKSTYQANANRYLTKLDQLDADIRAAVAHFKSREMVTFHASWVYFIHDYGLHQAAVLETTPGKEPSAAEVAKIVEIIQRTGAPAVFTEPQFSPQAAQVIAKEAGVPVLMLDPLGGLPPRETYLKLMYWNLEQLKKGLGANTP